VSNSHYVVFHFVLLQFRLFDNFGRRLKKNFFTANALSAPAELAPAAINIKLVIHAGHTGFLHSLQQYDERKKRFRTLKK
jgi:hypothetical protein